LGFLSLGFLSLGFLSLGFLSLGFLSFIHQGGEPVGKSVRAMRAVHRLQPVPAGWPKARRGLVHGRGAGLRPGFPFSHGLPCRVFWL
jgi:hypothetical protein